MQRFCGRLFSSEIDLGYCGALRTAATVLADDPIFGQLCFGGEWRETAAGFEIVPKDGLRRGIHALLAAGKLRLMLDNDRFAAGQPIDFAADLSRVQFTLESDNPAAHATTVGIQGLKAGDYTLSRGDQPVTTQQSTLQMTSNPPSRCQWSLRIVQIHSSLPNVNEHPTRRSPSGSCVSVLAARDRLATAAMLH